VPRVHGLKDGFANDDRKQLHQGRIHAKTQPEKLICVTVVAETKALGGGGAHGVGHSRIGGTAAAVSTSTAADTAGAASTRAALVLGIRGSGSVVALWAAIGGGQVSELSATS
jgi:hypothetical protein